MKFLVLVLPAHTMMTDVNIIKMTEEAALIEGAPSGDNTVVTPGVS